MPARLLIHVGYHKTATSWMQQLLFTPEHGFRQIAGHREVFDHIVAPHGLRFDAAAARAMVGRGLDGLGHGAVPEISSEILSGHPFFGGIGSDIYAERLKSIAPDARILISIRAQRRILPSVYMQYLSRGGTMGWKQFFAGETDIGYAAFRPEHFEYDRLVALYRALFGAVNVHVLTQESLKADMASAVAGLAAFAGTTDYGGLSPAARRVYAPSYPEYAAPFLRRANHFRKSVLNPNPVLTLGGSAGGPYRLAGGVLRRFPFAPLLAGRRPVSAYVADRFAGYFDASNARLGALLGGGTDLSDYR
ncbi:MAG: hypothetical protein CVT84_01230 [Alphaproteobacteria bacterium HGW-Alphaproteobacteria-6]|nr:MAG: hypothetical protein CVT84_01230 [Alphaproteobacteria bacterium HGW-Alphaproteobacteria-6]